MFGNAEDVEDSARMVTPFVAWPGPLEVATVN
jgi:hypothetical protein